MSNILLLRHGSYDPGQTILNSTGKTGTYAIGKIILEKYQGYSFSILTSGGPRAIETATIVKTMLPITSSAIAPWLIKEHDASTLLYDEVKERIGSYSKKDDTILICITNGKFLRDYTHELCKELGTENPISNLVKNEMCLLQYAKEENTLERLY